MVMGAAQELIIFMPGFSGGKVPDSVIMPPFTLFYYKLAEFETN